MRLICIELLRCIYYTHIILIFLSYLDDCFLKQRVGIAFFEFRDFLICSVASGRGKFLKFRDLFCFSRKRSFPRYPERRFSASIVSTLLSVSLYVLAMLHT